MSKFRNKQGLLSLSNTISKMPLWAILIIPFVTIIIVVVSTASYLDNRNSQIAIDNIAGQLLNEINSGIETRLETFFNAPLLINQNNAAVFRENLLDPNDIDAVTNHYWQQVQFYDTVSSIYFGNPEGGLVSAGHDHVENSYYVLRTSDFVSGELTKYNTDENGNLTDIAFSMPEFDARVRPWYISAINEEDVSWTAPYVLSTGQDLAMASSLAIRNDDNEIIGVTSVDIFLSHISQFLSSLAIGQSGEAYIIDHMGTLVATSTDTPLFLPQGEEAIAQRLLAIDSENPIISSSAVYVQQGVFPLHDFSSASDYSTFEYEGKEHYLHISPFHNIDGLDFFIVVTIPKADFLGDIQSQVIFNLLLTTLAVIVAIIIGSLLTIRVLRPITNLSNAALKLAKGNWSEPVAISGFRETHNLASAFNMMSDQLRESFGKLESGILERTSELSLSEARYRTIVENQTELICRFTPAPYTITFVNQALCNYLRKDEDELLNANFITSISHTHLEDLTTKLAALSSEQPSVTLKNKTQSHDGQARWMQWVFYAIYNDRGEKTEIQAVGRDITDEIIHEQALKNTLEKETELSRLKSQFITTMSHEFRTPMAIILNSSQMLETYSQRLSDEKKAKHFQRIHKQIFQMTALLDDLLTINRGTLDKVEFNPQALNLRTFIEIMISNVQAMGLKDVVFELSLADCEQDVVVDKNLLRLILINLFSNAVKFSLAQSTVNIDVSCAAEQIQISVKDRGIGIPIAARPHILDPFYRAENVDVIAGTGLGLAIVKQSVEKHGGKLSYVSVENKGTTFTVVLPQNKVLLNE